MIRLERVSRIYRLGQVEVPALKSISLEIGEGEFVAVTGASGSGKSTLLHILGLLDRPTSDSYHLEGRDTEALTEDERTDLRSRSIGFVFQQFSLLSRTSALHNVMLPQVYYPLSNGRFHAEELLNMVGLGNRAHHFPNQLSGGQQQRVAIARALANQPKLLLADEPTGNLDSSARDEILSIFHKLHQEGFTVVVVTHEAEISQRTERIIRFKDGEIIDDHKNKDYKERIPAGAPFIAPPVFKKEFLEKKPLDSDTLVHIRSFSSHFRQASCMLLSHRLRSFLSILGILIGVTCLIAMLSIGRGAQFEMEQQLSSMGTNLLIIRPGPASIRGVALEIGKITQFTFDDLAAIRQNVAGIVEAAGYVTGLGRLTYGNKNWSTRLDGASPEYISMLTLDPTQGKAFTEVEDLKRERVALIGTTVKEKLFGSEDPEGKAIRIDRVEFTVFGVLPSKGGNAWRDRDDIVLVPLRTAMARLLGRQYLDQIYAQVESVDDMPYVSEAISELLMKRHRLDPNSLEAFHIRNMADVQEALAANTRTFSLLLGAVAAVSLLVGGIGIMNIMLVSVTERTREIGIRKAIGAKNRDVLFQFLVESVVLSVLGGLFGILLGCVISWAVAQFAGWPSVVTFDSIFIGFFFSFVLGVSFGLWPAWRASRLDPIQALRYE